MGLQPQMGLNGSSAPNGAKWHSILFSPKWGYSPKWG